MTTAGLSRAYAVLRQLDVLRTDDILHPLPLPPSPRERQSLPSPTSGERTRSLSYWERSAGDERSRRPAVEADGAVNSPYRRAEGAVRVHGDGVQRAPSPPPPVAAGQQGHRGPYLMPPPPSYTDAMSTVSSAAPSVTAAPRRATRGVAGDRDGSRRHAASSAGQESTPRLAERDGEEKPFVSRAAASRRAYADHVYMRHTPKSSPHRTRVLAPVVLPTLSSSEADHMLAHATSRLGDYFDRDDLSSVLASVAVAAREAGSAGSAARRGGEPNTSVTVVSDSTALSPLSSARGSAAQPVHRRVGRVEGATRRDRSGEGASRIDDSRYDLRHISVTPSMERVLDAIASATAAHTAEPEDTAKSPNALTLERQRLSSEPSRFYTDAVGRRHGREESAGEYRETRGQPDGRRMSPPEPSTSSSGSDSGSRREQPYVSTTDARKSQSASPTKTASPPGTNDDRLKRVAGGRTAGHESLSRSCSAGLEDEASASADVDGAETDLQGGGDRHNEVALLNGSAGEDEGEVAATPSSAFPAPLCDRLPFLDYLARVNVAGPRVLLKELSAMGEAWAKSQRGHSAPHGSPASDDADDGGDSAVSRDEEEVVDCLALTLLLNKPEALQHIAVPLLRRQLKDALRSLRDSGDPDKGGRSGGAGSRRGAHYWSHQTSTDSREGRGGRGDSLPLLASAGAKTAASRAAHVNSVLCAVIGLGSAAASLLTSLLQLLSRLPPPSPEAICDVRLVCLAIRTAGATEGLRSLTRIVEERAEPAHVLTAAAYALSTYAYELAGHTSVVCVPVGILECSRDDVRYRLVPDLQAPTTALAASTARLDAELQPLWSGVAKTFGADSSSAVATAVDLLQLQSPPPYRPTHIVLDAEAARQSLLLYISSDVFRVRPEHPFVIVLVDDAVNSALLCAAATDEAGAGGFKQIWDRMRGDLHRVLQEATPPLSCEAGVSAAGLALPSLPYSMNSFFADEKDMLFAVESALVHALVLRASPLLQEQALITLSTLPPAARRHVVQPVTDFFLKLVRRRDVRRAASMRRSRPTTLDDSGDAESADEEEVVLVAAAMAAAAVCVNDLAPAACTTGCVASLLPVLTALVRASAWRLRHAACVALARIGPHTADPAAVVDLFLSLLAPATSASFLANSSGSEGRVPALQPATVVWCLAQQRQGGVRALLRVLQDPQESPPVHEWCAFQLAAVDVRGACRGVGGATAEGAVEAEALLDELVQVLGRLIAMQGALEEDTVLLCVRALAMVVDRAAPPPVSRAPLTAAGDERGAAFVLPLQRPEAWQEAATYYDGVPLCSSFTVLTSVMEAALLPTNVLKALCFYLAKYGGPHGELYVCEMLLEGATVAARSAAAFGLRGCGATVVRSVVLGMNDASFEVRREALDTMESFGVSAVLDVLRRRPAEHQQQVVAALRDCLLQDAGRPVSRRVAENLYRILSREED